ncbi:MAG: hypothetical protein ACKVHE_20455 [Planctomycetales bacterium]|jgi:hypothetical protein
MTRWSQPIDLVGKILAIVVGVSDLFYTRWPEVCGRLIGRLQNRSFPRDSEQSFRNYRQANEINKSNTSGGSHGRLLPHR